MRTVVFGTSPFAVPALEAAASHAEVVAVITQPDRPAGRGHRLTPSPVKTKALECGFDVRTPERLRPEVEAIRALRPDLFVVASYGRIVPQALLDVVPLALNVHPSLLPLYRGATPLQSAIRDGRTETGVTIIAMDAGMDTGDIVLQERTPLGAAETYGELHDRLAVLGAQLLGAAIDGYRDGTLVRIPQSEVARRDGISGDEIAHTATRPLAKDDYLLDERWTARRIVDHVRALAPAPAARANAGDVTLKVLAAHVAGDVEPPLGVRAGDGAWVAFDAVVAPNRGPMSGEAFARQLA